MVPERDKSRLGCPVIALVDLPLESGVRHDVGDDGAVTTGESEHVVFIDDLA